MVFSSVPFLFFFFPVVLILYCIVPKNMKNAVMIVGSMFFFAWGEIRYIPVLCALSVSDYVNGRLMEKYRNDDKKRKIFMLIAVGFNLAVLIFFKYVNFLASVVNSIFGTTFDPGIILPIGVSFNCFQTISYAIDVYRGNIKAEKKYYNYLTYTTLFPQIISGPIVRYKNVQDDIGSHMVTLDGFSRGARRFLVGMAKKVLIANRVGFLWEQILTGTAGQDTVLLYWLGIVAYTFQIYFDFSGYTDMAIGIATIFGLTFPENFAFPYISRSITEFWRRWHMTLGNWFRDYVYIPLGGNRKGTMRQIFNIFVVWALTGFWHGASWNFAIWGVYFAVVLSLEKFFMLRWISKLPSFFQHVYTMLLVVVGWVIFSGDNIAAKMGGMTIPHFLGGMFGFNGLPFMDSQTLYYLLQYLLLFLIAAYLSTPHFYKFLAKVEGTQSVAVWAIITIVYIAVFLVCVAFIVSGSYSPFLYLRF